LNKRREITCRAKIVKQQVEREEWSRLSKRRRAAGQAKGVKQQKGAK
jgi:hypothetical protein